MRWKTGKYAGWGRALDALGDLARPEKVADLRAIFKQRPLPAFGNRRSYGDAALNDGGKAIDMTRLNRIISFDPETGILEAEAGITIGEIAKVFAPKGFLPMVMPGTGFATLGGAIAHDVHGKNHHQDGSFGQHVTEIELLGPNGRIRRITPQTKDLFAATIGGLGQTGIILSAKIKLMAEASPRMDVRESRISNLAEFLDHLNHSSARFTVGWIDATANGDALGRGILEEASFHAKLSAPKARSSKSVPFDLPGVFMSPFIVRFFNAIYLRRVAQHGQRRLASVHDFFFPLDRIHNWNRLYGKAGFHQFQCVIPDQTAPEALEKMLKIIASSGLASPLAVLKRLGDGRAGLMSFPTAGMTLAVDFKNTAKAKVVIAELSALTREFGGRVYFAKDALIDAEAVVGMYPELPKFQKIIQDIDPKNTLETGLTRRLNLRGAK